MTTIEEIRAYCRDTENKIKSLIKKYVCRNCHDKQAEFKIHERRRRKWLFINANGLVESITSYLARLKCKLCHKIQTIQPKFSIPFKRYTLKEISGLGRSYINKQNSKYADEVLYQSHGKVPCFYIVKEQSAEGIRRLHASTLWRWVGWIGSQKNLLNQVKTFLLQDSPNSIVHRYVCNIPRNKYRSDERRGILETCKSLFFLLDKIPIC